MTDRVGKSVWPISDIRDQCAVSEVAFFFKD